MSSAISTDTKDTTKRHLGVVSYQASPTEEPHRGDIVSVVSTTSGKKETKLRHDQIDWANALVWIDKHFQNSGKSCSIRVTPLSLPQQPPSTPRPIFRSYSYKTGFI